MSNSKNNLNEKKLDLQILLSKPYALRNSADGLQSEISELTGIECRDPSLAQQFGKDDADINVILDRFTQTGLLLNENQSAPKYGDFSDVEDFHNSMNVVTKANELFMELPAKLRARFHNDPAQYVDFVLNPENAEEALKLGILEIPESKSETPEASHNATPGASAPSSPPASPAASNPAPTT